MGSNLDTMRRFLAAWQEGWEPACKAFLSDDFVCIEPPELPQGGVFAGWDAPIRISNIYRGLWDIDLLDAQFYDEEGSGVVVSRYLMTWTSKATGKSMTQPVVELNHVAGGKIIKMEVFHFDPAGLVATLTP
ncbi:MAG TPA: nuclear transport factor 2 family protein [Stellaceae bacterium]|nr:nuclear transport factor 2 family protein [Stellaceae bacterium]